MEERHLSLSEAADALGISERTAYRWINLGKLRAYKPGRDYRIPESAIREAVEESEVRPKAERRSSLEPSLFNGLEDERRSRFARAVALVADKWSMDVASTLTSDHKRLGIIEAAIDLSDAINESVEDWSALAHQDQVEILTAMEKLREVAELGLKHLEQSAQNRAEEETFEERREQIRQWTKQIA
jgi:excisionase family DNA binding protein